MLSNKVCQLYELDPNKIGIELKIIDIKALNTTASLDAPLSVRFATFYLVDDLDKFIVQEFKTYVNKVGLNTKLAVISPFLVVLGIGTKLSGGYKI